MGSRPGLGAHVRVHPVLDRPGRAGASRSGPPASPCRSGGPRRDPERIGAIERDRREPVSVLWATRAVRHRAAPWRSSRRSGRPSGRSAACIPKLGPMTVDELVERFLVGHLEEHADQLEGMAPPRSSGASCVRWRRGAVCGATAGSVELVGRVDQPRGLERTRFIHPASSLERRAEQPGQPSIRVPRGMSPLR